MSTTRALVQRTGLIALGLLVGLTLCALIVRLSGRRLWPADEPLNGLTPPQVEQWRAHPRFFVRQGDRFITNHPNMAAQSFSVEKEPADYRVFLLGSSQAMGDPYVHARPETEGLDLEALHLTNSGGIATWLEEYLQIVYPQRRVQVVNAAAGNQNVTTAAQILEEIAAVGQPDLVVVLSGNNESFNQTYDSTAAFERSLETLTGRYATALGDMIATAQSAGFPVYLLTVPTNLRDWLPSLRNQRMSKEAIDRVVEEGDWAAAIETLQALGEQPHALYHYALAKRHEAAGKDESAYAEYQRAKDADDNLIRTHSKWNDLIRAAHGDHIQSLDLEAIMRSHAQHRIPGFDMFHDNCHFKIDANMLAAREIAAFHRRVAGIAGGDLPRIDVRARLNDNLQALYAIKERKWERIRGSSEFTFLGERNALNVQKQFATAAEELTILDTYINLYEREVGQREAPRP